MHYPMHQPSPAQAKNKSRHRDLGHTSSLRWADRICLMWVPQADVSQTDLTG